jgi:hypothetical protein
MDAASLMRARTVQPQGSSVRAMIDAPPDDSDEASAKTGVKSLEELSPLPDPTADYSAYARAANKPLLTLRFLLADASIKGFSYANLDTIDLLPSGKGGAGPAIVMRFTSATLTEVKIEGRKLEFLYDQLGHHRIAWTRELPAEMDFQDDKTTVIHKISIGPVPD